MQAYTYISKGKFELVEKPKPVLMHERDAIVKVTLASICSSDYRQHQAGDCCIGFRRSGDALSAAFLL